MLKKIIAAFSKGNLKCPTSGDTNTPLANPIRRVSRVVCRDGFVVSTIDMSKILSVVSSKENKSEFLEPFETAIWPSDTGEIDVVGRAKTLDEALEMHRKTVLEHGGFLRYYYD